MALPRRLMIAVSFGQGLLLLLLKRAVDAGNWPADDLIWLTSLTASMIAVPIFFLFTVDSGHFRKLGNFLLAYALIVFLTAAYCGLQLEPNGTVQSEFLPALFTLTLLIATFKAVMYTQCFLQERTFSYQSLLNHSWENFLIMGFALLFALLFTALLFLWGSLFSLIGVGIFSYLFRQDWFLIPALTVAFGFAVITFRNLTNIVENVSRLLKTLLKFLLPILTTIAILFLLFLPFTGLQRIWDTDFGSGLLMLLQALTIFAVNAVYQSEQADLPYPKDMHRFIYIAVAALPIYSIMIFYGLSVRIAQYGLTLSRAWAILIAILLACFCLGYLVAIIRNRDNWLHGLAWVNIRSGILVMIVMILVNTPVLNLQSISAKNQLDRHLSGAVPFNDLDLNYLRWSLGRPGYLALEELKSIYLETEPAYAERIELVLLNPRYSPLPLTAESIKNRLIVWPEPRELPEEILDSLSSDRWTALYALFVDLNSDGQDEILMLFEENNSGQITFSTLWVQENTRWLNRGAAIDGPLSLENLDLILEQNMPRQEPSLWNDLILGASRIRINP